MALFLHLLAHSYNALKFKGILRKKAVSPGTFVPFGTFLGFHGKPKYPGEKGG